MLRPSAWLFLALTGCYTQTQFEADFPEALCGYLQACNADFVCPEGNDPGDNDDPRCDFRPRVAQDCLKALAETPRCDESVNLPDPLMPEVCGLVCGDPSDATDVDGT